MSASPITTHILDTASGKPAAGITVYLERKTHAAGWQKVSEGMTNVDGRIMDLMSATEAFLPGLYRLVFETAPYFLLHETETFFPQVAITFSVKDTAQHYHVPLLLSPFGYSTYRGS
jgi:5-hydroxyisourate hydrolase